ncbi:hypothetical protein J19TS2_25930 [Cohnella xylanilytica]|uniref:YmfQ family protein n=1 Tax=Cohnella xylanilytica TaxID=557555 RepID=UPI001B0AEC53|nr:YmfQ family protein [Cohnella xylanilytica]GIO13038.1 hypothetical protein J19TS2_25930 [Cohnella xylanilytica]
MSEPATMQSERGKEMLGYLPPYYATSRVMKSLMDAQGGEMDRLRSALDEILDQFFISTATWGLEAWEWEFDIATDSGKPIEQRRSAVKSKILGTGTVTFDLIRSVAGSYQNGKVDIVNQPTEYRFTVKFVDTLGLPPNLNDVRAAIEAIKPAHLAVEYEFRYFTIGEVQKMTIQQIQSHRLTDFAPFLDA